MNPLLVLFLIAVIVVIMVTNREAEQPPVVKPVEPEPSPERVEEVVMPTKMYRIFGYIILTVAVVVAAVVAVIKVYM